MELGKLVIHTTQDYCEVNTNYCENSATGKWIAVV